MADDLIQFDGGVLVADMLQESSVTDASDLTQYAIEDGSLISDHMIRQPQTLQLTLVQTETPITEVAGFSRVTQLLAFETRQDGQQSATAPVPRSEFRPAPLLALSAAVRGALFGGGRPSEISWSGLKSDGPTTARTLQVQVLAAGAPVARVNEFHSKLVNLLATATPCIVTVKGRSYPDLVLVNCTRTDARGESGRASFSVQFKQISIVETQTVDLPPVPKAKAVKEQKTKPPEETTDTQQKKLTVTLQGLKVAIDAVKSLFQ